MTTIVTRIRSSLAIALAAAALGAVPTVTFSQDEATLDLAGAWAQLRAAELDTDSALEAKTRALIGLAVAAHIACGPCVHVHVSLARAHGANGSELAQALAAAGLTRRLATVLSDVSVDSEGFRTALSEVMSVVGPQVAELD
jgi:AhpD family alkylhydroperoxidase